MVLVLRHIFQANHLRTSMKITRRLGALIRRRSNGKSTFQAKSGVLNLWGLEFTLFLGKFLIQPLFREPLLAQPLGLLSFLGFHSIIAMARTK